WSTCMSVREKTVASAGEHAPKLTEIDAALGLAAFGAGRVADARAAYARAEEEARAAGRTDALGVVLCGYADMALREGNTAAAERLYAEARTLYLSTYGHSHPDLPVVLQ